MTAVIDDAAVTLQLQSDVLMADFRVNKVVKKEVRTIISMLVYTIIRF